MIDDDTKSNKRSIGDRAPCIKSGGFSMRHANMIMAHNQVELLNILIKKVDEQNNDIIIHLALLNRCF